MFLSTIRQRVASHGYRSVDEFSSDVSKLLDSVPKASTLFKDKVLDRYDHYASLLSVCMVANEHS